MTLQEALNEFLFQKKLAGLSPKSIEDYQTILGILLTAAGSSMPLESLSYTTVANYILSLYDRPLSRSTVATYIRNIRIFLHWVYREYGLSLDRKSTRLNSSH